MANGFTEWLNIGLPGQPILAEAQDLFGLVFLLIAALVGWINKRKDASKLEQASHAVPTQRSQRPAPAPAPAQAGKPTGWLARLEQLAQTQLDQTDRESESHYDDSYEQESVDLPPVIGTGAPVTPPLVGTTQEAYRDTPLTNQLREAEQASVTRKTASGRSPIYDSPIYTGNIAHHIGTDLRAAQQAVVGSIILGAPKSLESPGQVNRQ